MGAPFRIDGDLVTIDAETNEITMAVSDGEISERLSKWEAPKLKINRGTLAKYARLVGDASHGVSDFPPFGTSLRLASYHISTLPASRDVGTNHPAYVHADFV